MKKYMPYLKNKFVVAFGIFLVYILFLDDIDIFMIFRQKQKLSVLKEKKEKMKKKFEETSIALKRLENQNEIERYAREKKLFKKDDEDLFVIYYTDSTK